MMADRGFDVSDNLAMCGAELLNPAFTRGKKQLSTQEVEFTRCLARVQIHVESYWAFKKEISKHYNEHYQ